MRFQRQLYSETKLSKMEASNKRMKLMESRGKDPVESVFLDDEEEEESFDEDEGDFEEGEESYDEEEEE
jgi:hypothetical protein